MGDMREEHLEQGDYDFRASNHLCYLSENSGEGEDASPSSVVSEVCDRDILPLWCSANIDGGG
jgi:hypothetical protein